MDIIIKDFDALSPKELYEILKLRSEVFIMEQNGHYLDPDGIDCISTHIFLKQPDGTILGCIRVFPKDGEPDTAQLGRLVVRDRMHGLGRILMEKAAEVAKNRYTSKKLFLTGRRDARGFYEKCGYRSEIPQGYTEESTPYYLFFKE